jgi:hypothetical protein
LIWPGKGRVLRLAARKAAGEGSNMPTTVNVEIEPTAATGEPYTRDVDEGGGVALRMPDSTAAIGTGRVVRVETEDKADGSARWTIELDAEETVWEHGLEAAEETRANLPPAAGTVGEDVEPVTYLDEGTRVVVVLPGGNELPGRVVTIS